MSRRFAFAATVALLAGCGPGAPALTPSPLSCPTGHGSLIRDALYFGLVEPDGKELTEPEWEGFLAAVVTPSFPQGFTVLAARGQWQGKDGTIVREPSRVLVLFHPAGDDADRKIRAIILRYRSDFQQEAVLWERSLACAAF